MELLITVRNRRAKYSPAVIVCGNTDYEIRFDFDAEWNAFPQKTACIAYRKDGQEHHAEIPFSGDSCALPALTGINMLAVGAFAGTVRTTAAARIPCVTGITELKGTPYLPVTDVYHAALEILAHISRNTARAKKRHLSETGVAHA